jgi:hypothetical protein
VRFRGAEKQASPRRQGDVKRPDDTFNLLRAKPEKDVAADAGKHKRS